jgi:hypothetical protein
MRFPLRRSSLSPSRVRTVDVGDETARSSVIAASPATVTGEAARTCSSCGVLVGHCYDDLAAVAGGFCGDGDPTHAWVTIAFGRSQPGVLRAEGWRAFELVNWMRRVGPQPLGPWAVLGPKALPSAPWDAPEVVDESDIEIVHHSSEGVPA